MIFLLEHFTNRVEDESMFGLIVIFYAPVQNQVIFQKHCSLDILQRGENFNIHLVTQ